MGAYKLLLTLMYGQHKWIERDNNYVRIPCAKIATHMRTRPVRIQKFLYLLEDWGVVDHISWNKYWATIRIIPPLGMRFIINIGQDITETIDVQQ